MHRTLTRWLALPLIEMGGRIRRLIEPHHARSSAIAIRALKGIPPAEVSPRSLFFLTRLYLADGQVDQAAITLHALTNRFPEAIETVLGRAFVADVSGGFRSAHAAYAEAGERAPEDPYMELIMGSYFRRWGALLSRPPESSRSSTTTSSSKHRCEIIPLRPASGD